MEISLLSVASRILSDRGSQSFIEAFNCARQVGTLHPMLSYSRSSLIQTGMHHFPTHRCITHIVLRLSHYGCGSCWHHIWSGGREYDAHPCPPGRVSAPRIAVRQYIPYFCGVKKILSPIECSEPHVAYHIAYKPPGQVDGSDLLFARHPSCEKLIYTYLLVRYP